MTASIIIPTYNGAHRISNILNAIVGQSVSPDEVIVVIDGSTDDTGQVVEEYLQKFINLKIVKQPNLGRAGVRNTGAKNAIGDLLIFYDDDTRPEPDSILRHKEFYRTHPNSICSGYTPEDKSRIANDIQNFKLWLSQKWTAKYSDGINELSDNDLFLTAANMSVPKKLFLELGGFEERLTDAEDFEFTVRAFSKGIPVYFDKSNFAWHDDFITCKSYICRQRQYNQAHRKLQAILPPTFQRSTNSATTLPLHNRIIYNLFSLKFWIIMADKGWLVWLPKKLRYKIYDIIITGLGKYYPQRALD